MQKIINSLVSGIYVLEIKLYRNIHLNHPKFSSIDLNRGYYFYVGSAQKNLQKRILRHQKKSKQIHWHIDYLTSNKNSSIKRIFVLVGADKSFETLISKSFISKKFEMPINGFGSSDDKSVSSHLFYSQYKLNHNHFSDLYHSIVCLKPASIDTDGLKSNSLFAFEILHVQAS